MDILDILKKYNISVPEDQVDNFNRDFRGAYKSAAEHKKVKDDLTAAQSKLDTASDFEGKYNTQVRKYETDMAAKQSEIDGLRFDIKLDKALSGVEFVNSRVRESVISEIKSKNFKVNDTGGIDGLDDYLKNLKNNEPDIFKSAPSGITSTGSTWAGGSSNTKPNIDTKNIFGRVR